MVGVGGVQTWLRAKLLKLHLCGLHTSGFIGNIMLKETFFSRCRILRFGHYYVLLNSFFLISQCRKKYLLAILVHLKQLTRIQ